VDGKVYAGTGDLSMLDPASATWTLMPNLPSGRTNASGGEGTSGLALVSSKIYIISNPQTNIFDTTTQTWTQGPDYPEDCYGFAAAGSLGTKVYVVGGYPCEASHVLDTQTLKWGSFPDGDHAELMAFPMAALGGKLYATGGYLDCWQDVVADAEYFDPSTNKWTSIAPMNTARSEHGLQAFNGKLWAAGGQSSPDGIACGSGRTSYTSVESYDPSTNKWTDVAALKNVHHNFGLVSLNTQIFALGGNGCTGEEFGSKPSPPGPSPAKKCSIIKDFMISTPSIKSISGVSSPEACCDVCDLTASCVAFTITSDTCNLKSDTRVTPAPGSTSGIQKQF
jgi:hypothetical protein